MKICDRCGIKNTNCKSFPVLSGFPEINFDLCLKCLVEWEKKRDFFFNEFMKAEVKTPCEILMEKGPEQYLDEFLIHNKKYRVKEDKA